MDKIQSCLYMNDYVRTPVVGLRTASSKNEIILIGAFHLATFRYYQTLMRKIEVSIKRDFNVLCEGFGDHPELEEGSKSRGSTELHSKVHCYQKAIMSLTGLVRQMDYLRPSQIHGTADVSGKAAHSLLSRSSLAQEVMSETYVPEKIAWDAIGYILNGGLVQDSSGDPLVYERDAHAAKITNDIAQVSSVVLIYGAKHIPGITGRLCDFGWQISSIEYVPAIPLRKLRRLKGSRS